MPMNKLLIGSTLILGLSIMARAKPGRTSATHARPPWVGPGFRSRKSMNARGQFCTIAHDAQGATREYLS